MKLAELREEIAARTGRNLNAQPAVQTRRLLGSGPGSGYEREYTQADVERVICWLRMNDLGGNSGSEAFTAALRRSALDLIPDDPELGAIVISAGVATWGMPTLEDVEAGMMAIWVYD